MDNNNSDNLLQRLEDWKMIIMDNLQEYITEPQEWTYGRNRIHQSPEYEVILMNLPPHTETHIHDHGQSIGHGIVLEGSIINKLYRKDCIHSIELIFEQHIANQQCFSFHHGSIHSINNPGNQRAVTLHLYSPQLINTNIYHETPTYVGSFI